MFYNGATQDARWRIGWVAFNSDCTRVVGRGIEPLVVPPPATAPPRGRPATKSKTSAKPAKKIARKAAKPAARKKR